MADITMRDTLKFVLGVVKNEVKETTKKYVDRTLYSKPYDFSQVVGYVGTSKQIRVIGPIVTIY